MCCNILWTFKLREPEVPRYQKLNPMKTKSKWTIFSKQSYSHIYNKYISISIDNQCESMNFTHKSVNNYHSRNLFYHRNIHAHLWSLFWEIISSSLDAALMIPSVKILQMLLAKGWTHVLTGHVSRNFNIEQ